MKQKIKNKFIRDINIDKMKYYYKDKIFNEKVYKLNSKINLKEIKFNARSYAMSINTHCIKKEKLKEFKNGKFTNQELYYYGKIKHF